MKKRIVATLFSMTLVGSLATQANAAGEYLGGNSHVQLNHIMASVQKPGSILPGIVPLVPTLTVPKAGDVAFVCQRAPRAAEALLQYFQDNPAPLNRRRHVDTDALDKNRKLVAAYVNRALGRAAVSEVFVSESGPKMAKGTAARMPFAKIQGCSRVLAEFEARMKKLLESEKKK